ncbi:MAG: NAD-dependent epimerase/dehydratase family protein [Candidatus Micrarchaeota archaeon]
MKIAVAGASGRLGRKFVQYCKKKKIPAIALVRSKNSLRFLPKKADCKLTDYSNPGNLKKSLEGITHIVNITGATDTTIPKKEMYNANMLATKRILDAAPPSLEKFIHISSIAVYGKNINGIADENYPKNPKDAYGKSKFEGEKLALLFKDKFNVIVLQPGIIYGKEFREGFYPILRNIKNKEMRIIGNGKNYVPLVHVDDIVNAIAKSVSAKINSGSTYILVATPSLTQLQLVETAAQMLGVDIPKKHISPMAAKFAIYAKMLWAKVSKKKHSLTGEMIDQLACNRLFSPEKAKKELGWKSTIPFKIGIEKVVMQFLDESKKG